MISTRAVYFILSIIDKNKKKNDPQGNQSFYGPAIFLKYEFPKVLIRIPKFYILVNGRLKGLGL